MEQKKIQRIIYSTKINATKISIKEQLLIIVVFRHRLDKKCNIGILDRYSGMNIIAVH